MNANDMTFLHGRRKITRWSGVAAGFLLVTILALAVLLWFWFPAWIDPGFVADRIQTGVMTRSLLETTAVLFPVLVWIILGLLVFIVLLCVALFVMERRYLRILERLVVDLAPGASTQDSRDPKGMEGQADQND